MWFCSRSQGQPFGARKRAMTRNRSLIAGERFFILGNYHPVSKYHQIIAVHDFDAFEFTRLDLAGAEAGNAARKLGTVQVTNAHDLARIKFAFTSGNARRQQALAVFPQGFPGAGVDEQRAFGMMEKGDPTLASL